MKMNIHILVRAVIIHHGSVLLYKVSKGEEYFILPGGHIEQGESAKQALHRELIEECGLEFTIKRFLGCLECSFPPQPFICHSHEYNLVFEAYPTDSEFFEGVDLEKKLQWVSLKSLQVVNLKPRFLKLCISEWLTKDCDSTFQSQISLIPS